jgi:hypothetical protein
MPDEAAWASLGAAVAKCQEHFTTANSTDEFQAVGLLCREAIISLAQAVWDVARHPIVNPPANGSPVSMTDAKRLLESYLAVELSGSSNDEFRKFTRSAYDLASKLVHDRPANFANAARCLEALVSVINLVAITEGRCSPERPWEINRSSVSFGQLIEAAHASRDDLWLKIYNLLKWPVPIAQGPLIMLHFYPTSALSSGFSLDTERLSRVHVAFRPAHITTLESRPTIDGWLLWQPRPNTGGSHPYHLATWLGSVSNEGVGTVIWQIADLPSQEAAAIDVDGVEFQTNLQATIGQIAGGYRALGISGVAIVSISLARVLNLRLNRSRPTNTLGIDRPFLHLPDSRLMDVAEPQADELKPSLDALWRAAGWSSGLTLTV